GLEFLGKVLLAQPHTGRIVEQADTRSQRAIDAVEALARILLPSGRSAPAFSACLVHGFKPASLAAAPAFRGTTATARAIRTRRPCEPGRWNPDRRPQKKCRPAGRSRLPCRRRRLRLLPIRSVRKRCAAPP